MNNLLVLSREQAGATLLWNVGAVQKLLDLIQTESKSVEETSDLLVAAQRVLDELARDGERVSDCLDFVWFWISYGWVNKLEVLEGTACVVWRGADTSL